MHEMVLERKLIFFETFTKQFAPCAVPSYVFVNVHVPFFAEPSEDAPRLLQR